MIGGGEGNRAVGRYSVIPGGIDNSAVESYTFAAGRRAKADHEGAFVWADSTDDDFASTRADEFAIRASGGIRLHSNRGISLNAASAPIITRAYDVFDSTVSEKEGHGRWGLFMEPYNLVLGIPAIASRQFQVAKYNPDGTRTALMTLDQNGNMTITGTYSPPSDRNVKTNFTDIVAREVLERVAALPIQRWNYRNDLETPHLGPVAQDFYAAFGVGADDKHIATVDADGVALAAIQGLNQKVECGTRNAELRDEDLVAKLEQKDREIEKMERRIDNLERLVDSLTHHFASEGEVNHEPKPQNARYTPKQF